MEVPLLLLLLALLVTLLFSAFFSGIEIAFISTNKLKVELKKNKGTRAADIIAKFIQNPSEFIGTTLIGNNIALVIFGIILSKLIEERLLLLLGGYDFLVLLVQTLITTLIVLFFGEFIPKALFRLKPYRILTFFAVPLNVIYWLLFPVVKGFVWISRAILKTVFRIREEEEVAAFNIVDLQHFIQQLTKRNKRDDDDELNTDLFEKALFLKDVKVRECMVPRTEVVALDINTPVDEARELFIESKLSKIPFYEDSVDKIIGYAHHFEFLNKPSILREILIPITAVPESMPARDMLNIFRREQKSIAWVVDEFGGTAGIVTMEDIIEEIFGEIEDEHDVNDNIEKQISESEYIFSGRLEVDYINEHYKLEIPDGEYETLSGFILANHESIPQMNEEILIGKFHFTILSDAETRIETVKLEIMDDNLG